MPRLFDVITPLGRAMRAFFQSDVHLRRGEGGLRVVFDEQPASKPRAKAEAARRASRPALTERQRRELARMLADLTVLLDQSDGNRAALQPLAMVEQGLRRSGLRVFEKMPLDMLKRAHAQLEGLVTNWSQEGLACLRSKLAVAVIEREVPEGPGDPVSHAEDVIEDIPVTHAMPLEGDDAREAEEALMAAYGGLALGTPSSPPPAATLDVEMQGELDSPSARAMTRETKGTRPERVDLRFRELPEVAER